MGHEVQDRVSLEIGRRVAAELPYRPELLALARENLDRWSRINSNASGLLRCYAEWRALLWRPLAEIVSLLVADSDKGQRLRQSSPFAGALSPAEVWDIKRRIRHEQTAA